jgi:hypothetical protein
MNSLSPTDHNLGNDLFLSDDDDETHNPLFKSDLTTSLNFKQVLSKVSKVKIKFSLSLFHYLVIPN